MTAETVLFGEKKIFAIELGFTKIPNKYKLGFWIKDKRLGDFKKAGQLKYSVIDYRKFVAEKDLFYRTVFDDFTSDEIFYYLAGIFLTREIEQISPEEQKSRLDFYLFFGDQFANQTGATLLLYKNNKIRFIIKRPMDGPVDSYNIDFQFFRTVYEDYIAYITENGLL